MAPVSDVKIKIITNLPKYPLETKYVFSTCNENIRTVSINVEARPQSNWVTNTSTGMRMSTRTSN